MTSPTKKRSCLGCFTGLPNQRLGQPRKYCSDECRSEYYRQKKRRPRTVKTPAARVLERSQLVKNGCLEFQGSKNEDGYGTVRSGSTTVLAHRAVWDELAGDIPKGLHVRHKCDNPPCVEITHLELGTHKDNMEDRDKRGRTLYGELGNHKLTWAEITQIRNLCEQGVTHRELSAQFNISKTHISNIRNWKTRVNG